MTLLIPSHPHLFSPPFFSMVFVYPFSSLLCSCFLFVPTRCPKPRSRLEANFCPFPFFWVPLGETGLLRFALFPPCFSPFMVWPSFDFFGSRGFGIFLSLSCRFPGIVFFVSPFFLFCWFVISRAFYWKMRAFCGDFRFLPPPLISLLSFFFVSPSLFFRWSSWSFVLCLPR